MTKTIAPRSPTRARKISTQTAWATPCDNCATTANADQADADADGFTDYPADSACGIGFEMAPLLLGIAALRRAGVASSGMRGA
ncbi:MAG: hypothetical protein NTZ61_15590 [Proteobacteria bacterium]|nr:hypothetical protein [Pseudomonadota bacterium]